MRLQMLLFLIFSGCYSKKDAEMNSDSPCKNEVYHSPQSIKDSFVPMFQKQFQMNAISEGCVRLYYIPSFHQEMVIEICQNKGVVRLPDTGTVWRSMQILNHDDNGRLISGRVADTTDSIPAITIFESAISDSISKSLLNQLDSMDVWNMRSISWADCAMADGIGIDVHSRKNRRENYFEFSVASYRDERYLLISQRLEIIYKDMVSKKIK